METPTFKYTPLDLDGFAFRLVRLCRRHGPEIECELIHTTLNENGIPYEAVSYTWGSDFKTDVISLNGRIANVTSNLYYILSQLRYSDSDRYLWIDAICIDQNNDRERGHQVQQMDKIYAAAECVLFHLGRPMEYTNLVMKSLDYLQKETAGQRWERDDTRWTLAWWRTEMAIHTFVDNFEYDQFRVGVEDLVSRPWFSRAWILQEVANARFGLVYCGDQSVSSRVFAVLPHLVGANVSTHSQAVLDLMPGFPPTGPVCQDFYSLLSKFGKANASEPRDRIYALARMWKPSEYQAPLIADYTKSITDVIIDTVAYITELPRDILPELPYGSIDEFIDGLPLLPATLLSRLIDTLDITAIESFAGRLGVLDASDKVLETEARNESQRDELHFPRRSRRTWNPDWITNVVVDAAAANERHALELIKTFLHLRGSIEITKQLILNLMNIQLGAQVMEYILRDSKNEITATAWDVTSCVATDKGDLGIMELILRNRPENIDVSWRNPRDYTALMFAAWTGNLTVAKLLVARGARINDSDIYDRTPFDFAINRNNKAVLEFLLQEAQSLFGIPSVCNRDPRSKYVRAAFADAEFGNLPSMKEALKFDRNVVEAKDLRGLTLLWYAVERVDYRMILYLVENGANMEAKNQFGDTPLLHAARTHQRMMATLLVINGANLNAKDRNGNTPLRILHQRPHGLAKRFLNWTKLGRE